MIELKPCPFCGGEAEIVAHLSGWYVTAKHRISCPMYGMELPDCDCYNSEYNVIDCWNRRATDGD